MYQTNFQEKNMIENRYFKNSSFKHLWTRRIDMLSAGELNWLGMIVACECDPRVLLIDDYGMYFNTSMEKDFRAQVNKNEPFIRYYNNSKLCLRYVFKIFCFCFNFFRSRAYIKIRTGNSRGIKKIRIKGRRVFQIKKEKIL